MNNYNRYTFKAKRKDNGEWIYGSLLFDINTSGRSFIVENGVTSYKSSDKFIGEHINTYLEIDKDTVCQCTGLQDRDGNYIFENDIVELNNIEFRVDWSCGCFEFSHDCDIDKNCDDADYINPIDYKVDECKIIGNRFDKEVE